jgi:hypothetical protein
MASERRVRAPNLPGWFLPSDGGGAEHRSAGHAADFVTAWRGF